MKNLWALLLCVLLILPMSGCGTLITKIPFPAQGYEVPSLLIFPGVLLGVVAITEGHIYMALDLPFSLGGDLIFFALKYPMKAVSGVVKILLNPWFH
jgi:uncharacterized protein YceK